MSIDNLDYLKNYPLDQVIQGDCLQELLKYPDNFFSCCITDPPYNYEFIGHNWDDTETHRRLKKVNAKNSNTLVKNIPYGSGLSGGVRNERWYKKNRENILKYQEWCISWGMELYRVCKPGATIAIFNSTRTIAHIQIAMENAGFYSRDILVYRRNSGIPKGINMEKKMEKDGVDNAHLWRGWHSCFRGEWEAICILQKPLENNYFNTLKKYGTGLFFTELPDGGFQSNIIENIRKEKIDDFNTHPTVKPLELMEKLVTMLSPNLPNSIIVDPFAGSGTTLLAAKNKGVHFVGIEINPDYIEICRKRLSV